MTLDLVIASVTLVFALWGFFSGAARQIALFLGWAAAWAAVGPAGQFFGPAVAGRLATSSFVGVVIASLAAFVLVLVLVQFLASTIIRRILAGRDRDSRALDRIFGFLLGGAKVLAVMYVALCAASFLESTVVIAGRKLAFTPKDSKLMELVRQYNLLELRQFSGSRELASVVQLAKDPKAVQRLRENVDFSALSKDPRFFRIANNPALAKALESGDIRALIANNDVVELIHDATTTARVERILQLP